MARFRARRQIEERSMSVTEETTEGTLQQIDQRIKALAAAEKSLKKPSTISFAERQSLASKAAKALAELRAQRGTVEGTEAAEATEPAEAVKAALAEADQALGKIEAAQPAGAARRSPGASTKVTGMQRRGGGMNAQQRGPDRIGGE
ncbi:MAG: hypothetical protein K0Q72_3388 [Armatimonadetes bacterium]|jgi:hypothetical protein|nr:hypothetical protein [Armatimonadota bacterium]